MGLAPSKSTFARDESIGSASADSKHVAAQRLIFTDVKSAGSHRSHLPSLASKTSKKRKLWRVRTSDTSSKYSIMKVQPLDNSLSLFISHHIMTGYHPPPKAKGLMRFFHASVFVCY